MNCPRCGENDVARINACMKTLPPIDRCAMEQFSGLENFRPQRRKDDPVHHPKHYTNHPSGVECITITRHMGFNLGNAMKYIWRADLKNGIEDLEKALWYITDEIAKRKEYKYPPEQCGELKFTQGDCPACGCPGGQVHSCADYARTKRPNGSIASHLLTFLMGGAFGFACTVILYNVLSRW